MVPATINGSTFTLTQGESSLAGNVAYSRTTAIFISTGILASNAPTTTFIA